MLYEDAQVVEAALAVLKENFWNIVDLLSRDFLNKLSKMFQEEVL